TSGILSTYNLADIHTDLMQVSGTWNMFESSVGNRVNTLDPRIEIAAGAQWKLYDGTKLVQLRVENYGQVDGQNETLYIGAINFPVFFTNHSGGVIRNASFYGNQDPSFPSSYVINEGEMHYTGGAPQLSAYFANSGWLELDGSQMTV